ncbi:MAG: oxygenase MpaB family protein [Chitinophagaceae bacterium]
MEFFVNKQSVVRKIWGKSDTVLFVFAGAAAEFALNKAVDWLYFTGRLPADPLGRLFSTVMYARLIVFSEKEKALNVIDKITSIHQVVESNRGAQIPDWAYRDVLFMLIHYSIASYELLEKKLSPEEKEEVFDVFYRVGDRMHLKGLPTNYADWLIMHEEHLRNDLVKSDYTIDLYKQYKKHLGTVRYKILIESQKLVIPSHVNKLLGLGKISWVSPLLSFYKLSRKVKLDGLLKSILLPPAYKKQIRELDINQIIAGGN